MSDKFGDGRDPYLYPGLNVMRNRLGIHQAQRLAQAAYELTALRAATIELGPLKRGLPHLCAIHRQLYRDIFDWAGHLREVDIYQGDTRRTWKMSPGWWDYRKTSLSIVLRTIIAKSMCCIRFALVAVWRSVFSSNS